MSIMLASMRPSGRKKWRPPDMCPRRTTRFAQPLFAPRAAELRSDHSIPQSGEGSKFHGHEFRGQLQPLQNMPPRVAANDARRDLKTVPADYPSSRYVSSRYRICGRTKSVPESRNRTESGRRPARTSIDVTCQQLADGKEFLAFGPDRRGVFLRGNAPWRANLGCAQAHPVRLRRRHTWVMQGR